MNNIRIVPMTADHLDALEQLERTCFSQPWSRKMLAEEQIGRASCRERV